MVVLYPSIDVLGGRVVRLAQGDYERETIYDRNAVDVAEDFVVGGACWIHVVDLDAARGDLGVNRDVVRAITAAVSGRAEVQTGGGVRSFDDAAALADAGVARVVMGSAAVADPGLVETVAARIPVAVGLDHRAGVLAVHGWTQSSDLALIEALVRFPSASAFVITDIERDGLLGGPDVEGLRTAVGVTEVPVIASGGVGSLDDLAALTAIEGLHGVVTGRSLYEGRFTVAEALAVLE